MSDAVSAISEALQTYPDFVLLAPTWPDGNKFGGEFIQSRVVAYAEAGLRGVVVDYSSSVPGLTALTAHAQGFIHAKINASELPALLALLSERPGLPVLVHSPPPDLQHALVDKIPGHRLAVWYHGYEVRDHRRIYGNTDTRQFALTRQARDALNVSRFEAAGRVFQHPGATVVFVSQFQRNYSEFDVGTPASHALIIPNFINGDLYRGHVRQPDDVRKILLMRAFTARNYGNDIATRALLHLSERRGFKDLQITISGFGQFFQGAVNPLRHLSNVTIRETYSRPAEMASLHFDHGVFLCPSRFDTHGVMLGEAMSSGMATVTNAVAAIPEFTDATSSVLCRPDDPLAFAEGLWHLIENPDLVPVLSRNAMRRVAVQCSREQTVGREMALIHKLADS